MTGWTRKEYDMNKVKLDLVIFDMDGLMFDTERIGFKCWKQAAALFGYDITEELYKETIGSNFSRAREIYVNSLGPEFPIEEAKEERLRLGKEHLSMNGVPIKEGLYDLLDYLKQSHIRMAVATSTSRERALKLTQMAGIDMYFECFLCGDEVERSKPEPEIFLKVADRLKCCPNRCIVLEDSEAGIIAAYRAGMIPVMVPDMKEPGENLRKMIYKRFDNLYEVKDFFMKQV